MREDIISTTIPSYIRSQTGFYNQLAEEFFTETAKAKTEEEYNITLRRVCKRYQRQFTDNNVIEYYLSSGVMDIETVDTIRKFYIDNAEPFQKSMLEAELEENEKYTLVYLSDFGFPVTDKIILKAIHPIQYAQYTDALKLILRRPRKRSDVALYFYGKSLAVYKGWLELPQEVNMDIVKESNGVTTRKSKYGCFDSRYFDDCLKFFGEPVVVWKDYKIRESDSKTFA